MGLDCALQCILAQLGWWSSHLQPGQEALAFSRCPNRQHGSCCFVGLLYMLMLAHTRLDLTDANHADRGGRPWCQQGAAGALQQAASTAHSTGGRCPGRSALRAAAGQAQVISLTAPARLFGLAGSRHAALARHGRSGCVACRWPSARDRACSMRRAWRHLADETPCSMQRGYLPAVAVAL